MVKFYFIYLNVSLLLIKSFKCVAELAKKLGLEINMMNEDEDDDMEDADEDENLEEEDDTNFVDDSIVKIKKHDG